MNGLGQASSCLDEGQAVFLGSCIANLVPPGMAPEGHAALCAALEDQGVFELPYCPGTTRLPIPECLSADEVAGIDYCHYGDGSSPYYNALCWGAQKDPAWWQQYIATPSCAGVATVMTPPMTGMAPQSDAVEPPPPEGESRTLLYVGLGLLGLVVIAGAIYVARK